MNNINDLISRVVSGDERIQVEIETLDLKYKLIDEVILYRREHHLSQATLAKLLNVKEKTIVRFELGEIDPKLSLISKLLFLMDKEMRIGDKVGETMGEVVKKEERGGERFGKNHCNDL